MNKRCDARVLLGGRVESYQGAMPSIAEEAVLALADRKPVFLLGGFGGCARDIAETMGLLQARAVSRASRWKGRRRFASKVDALGNGLTNDGAEFLPASNALKHLPNVGRLIPHPVLCSQLRGRF